MKPKNVIVIGAGIAGISSSIRLAAKGYKVRVFEQNSYPGGKLSEIRKDDFRWDAGPSLFTLPEQVDELFELAGEQARLHFNYTRLPIVCHYFWDDGTFLKAYDDENSFASEVEKVLGVDSSKVRKYLQKSRFIYETTAPVFLHQSLHKFKNYLNLKTLNGVLKMPRLGIFSLLHKENERQLGHPRLVQLFDRYATYNGSDPYQAPAVLQSIPHLEFGRGAWFPQGGMISITQSLTELAKRQGVEFNFMKPVDEIIVENSNIKGIRVGSQIFESEIVVCNSDIIPAYRKLLSGQPAPEKVLSQPRSSSALIFYWGVNKVFEQLDMHNIFFSNEYKKEFELITAGNEISDDPTVYINVTSHLQKSDAPEGCSNWFVMINVPGNKGQDWDSLIRSSKKNIIRKLNKVLHTNVESLIISESVLDPRFIESKTSSFGGSLYGSSSNNRYAAFLRHANYSSKIKNLYFCGGSVHPGGGIPLCLQSARIVSDLIPEA